MEPGPESTGFDTSKFLQFLFATLFLFVCVMVLIMYQHKLLSFAVQTVLRYCFLPSTSRVHLGGLLLSPPGCRIFFQNFFYQDENMTLRVTDGYISFVFWDSWFGDPSWAKVRDFMMKDDLKGTQCLAKVKTKWVRGVIVDVERSKRKLLVRLESGEPVNRESGPAPLVDDERFNNLDWGSELHEMADVDGASNSVVGHNGDENTSHRSSYNLEHSRESHRTVPTRQREVNVSCASIPSTSARMFYAPDCRNSDANSKGGGGDGNYSSVTAVHVEPEVGINGEPPESVKLLDMSLVRIQKKCGRVRVHLNGMELTFYNATGNYRKSETVERSEQQRKPRHNDSVFKSLWGIFRPLCKSENDSTAPRDPMEGREQRQHEVLESEEEMSSRVEDTGVEDVFDGARTRATVEQHRRKNTKSIMQRFYDFVGAVEVELFTSYVNIGGAAAEHPYFLRVGFKRADGLSYLAQEGVPSVDICRLVTEATLEELCVRWFPMKSTEEQHEPRSVWDKWRDSFFLYCEGVPPEQKPEPLLDEPAVLIKDYGTIIGNKEESSAHLVYYRDFPNVYAGEEVSCQSDLPKSGIELLIDTPDLCHGPWSNFSIMQLKEYFVPNTYQSVESLKFELGKKRPHGCFEIYIELLRETSLIIPFKRKTIAPTPPFGLCDSGRKGMVAVTLGRGSSYVQKLKNPLPHEEKQCTESLLTGLDVLVATNAIQEESAVCMSMDKIELFVDKLSDKPYNGRKLWNILPVMENAEVWWHMDYISFFGDLCLDWLFVPHMYHGKPFTTEEYNTYKLFVEEFIPTVRRFECIFAGTFKIHLNGNMHNAIYSENINDKTANVFLTLSTKTGGYMFVTVPSDSYLLSSVTEVRRPFEISVSGIELFLSVPHSHPLHELVDVSSPFGCVDKLFVKGLHTVNVPNQTVPQDMDPIDPETGQSKLRNYLDYEFDITGVRGHLMAPHIATFTELFENLFGGSSCVVRPDELFWPLSKIHPKINTPKNVRSAFHTYLQKDQPPTNSLDFNTTVKFTDIDVTLRTGEAKSPQVNLRFSTLDITVMRQASVTDIGLTISPIYGRLPAPLTGDLADSTFLCCGDVSLGIVRHFGLPPLRTLFYSASECVVDGISFYMTVEQVALLTELFTTLRKQFFKSDEGLLAEIEKARTVAAYSADNCVLTTPAQGGRRRVPTSGRPPACFRRVRTSSLLPRPRGEENARCKAARLTLIRFLTHGGPFLKIPFSELVPAVVASGFQEFLEQLDEAEDSAKDYAIHTILVSIPSVQGCVAVGPDNYFEVKFPSGVQLVSTTKNDLNSNVRTTAALRGIELCGYCRSSNHNSQDETSPFAEVFRLETSLQVQRSVAYPFDKGLEIHRKKQRHFVFEHDTDRFFTSALAHVRRPCMRDESLQDSKGGADDPHLSFFLKGEEEEGDERELRSAGVLHKLPVYNQDGKNGGDSVEDCKNEDGPTEATHHQGCEGTAAPPQQLKCSGREAEQSAGNVSTLTNTRMGVPAGGSSLVESDESDGTSFNKSETNVFATCVSQTDELLSYSDEDDMMKELCESDDVFERGICSTSHTPDDEFSRRVDHLPDECNDLITNSLDCVSSVSASPRASEGNTTLSRKLITSTHFLRRFSFDCPDSQKDTPDGCDNTAHNKRVIATDRTHFRAPMPTVGFVPSKRPPTTPTLRMLQRTVDACNGSVGGEGESAFWSPEGAAMWAKRTADNRKRSQEGTTSKQVHVEFLAPLNCLVAQDFVEKLLFDANTRLQSVFATHNLYSSLDGGETADTAAAPMLPVRHMRQTSGLKGMRNLIKSSSTPAEKEMKNLFARKQPSRNRAHQKRWYSEVDIWSVCIPSTRISVVTDFPLPSDNVVHDARARGVYNTQLCARSAQVVMQQTHPPPRATRQDETKTFSLSTTCSSLAVITQIEHEPLLRSDNPFVRVPGIDYDRKDTLAVLYFTSIRGRMRHQNTQGIQNGIYHLSVDTIAFHAARDFFFYLHSALALWERLNGAWGAQEYPRWYRGRPSPETWSSHNDDNEAREGSHGAPGSSVAHFEHLHSAVPTTRNYGIEGSRVFQGVGSIRVVRLELLDVSRDGHYLRVDTRCPNVVEISRLQAKFVVRVPMKRAHDPLSVPSRPLVRQNSSVTLSSSEVCSGFVPSQEWKRRPPQLSTVQIQFIGEVEHAVARCFPSLLHIMGAVKGSEWVADSPIEIISESKCSKTPNDEGGSPEVDCGFSSQPRADAANDCNQVTFRGSFALGNIDVCMIQSEMNFLQIKGTGLAGFGEARAEAINSRECVKTHVLTEAFSERIKRQLRAWADRARTAAPKGHYPTPPSVTPQLRMKNSGFFAAETMRLQYVADVVAPCTDGFEVIDYEEVSEKTHRQDPRVFVASTKQLRVDMHHAEQEGPRGSAEGCKTDPADTSWVADSSEKGEQVNVQVDIGSAVLSLPYRPKASEIVQPQLQQWVHEWLGPSVLQTMYTSQTVLAGGYHLGVRPQSKIYACCCSLRVRDTLLQSDLPQNMTSNLTIPLASLFLNASSEGRLALKGHLHPTKLSSSSPTSGRHTMSLPNIFVFYNSDRLRRSGMCLTETVEVTVSPIIVSHLLFIFNRASTVRSTLTKIFKPEAEQVDPQQKVGNLNLQDNQRRKSNFLLLVEGLRISYLTSMTNMRFSVWRLKGRMYTTEDDDLCRSHMTLKVANVQVALVDRDDYDQLQTFLHQSEYLQKRAESSSGRSSKEKLMSSSLPNSLDQERKRSISTLNGFIWGLFETSLTLSTGRSDTNELHSALKSIAATAPVRTSVSLRSLGNVGNTATRWNVAIFSPLLIARVGLAQLLQQSIDEAKELADKMHRAARRESRKYHRQLAKSAVYQRLTRLERRESQQMLSTQRQQVERLIALTNNVIPGQSGASQRRASIALSVEPSCEDVVEGSIFQTTSDHKFFVTMTNFLAVVPFGDAPYRTILEGTTDASHRGCPSDVLLNRKDFVPTMAMKVKVEGTTVVCRALMSQQRVPLLPTKSVGALRSDGIGAFLGATDSSTGTRQIFTSKFMLSDAHFYCSDGSPLERGTSARSVLSSTHVFGGIGTLTSPGKGEYRSSLSKVSFNSIEIPLHINRCGRSVSIGSVMDMSAPQISVSTQTASILSQFTNEMSAKSLSSVFRHREGSADAKTKSAEVIAEPSGIHTASGGPERYRRERGRRTRHTDPESPVTSVLQQAELTPILYNFDVTARLEAGEMYVYSIQRGTATNTTASSQQLGSTVNKVNRTSKRQVKFKPIAPGGEAEFPGSPRVPSGLAAKKLMSVLLKIPLPEVTAMVMGSYGGSMADEERLIARVEIRENTIEIDPSIISLAHEIEEWEVIQARDSAEHVANTLKLVKVWERDEEIKHLARYSTVADVALPLPRAFLSVLSNAELQSKKAVTHQKLGRLGNSHQPKTTSPPSLQDQEKRLQHGHEDAPTNHSDGKRRLLSVQIRVTEFRLVLTTEPASNISFTLSLDDRVGSVDFFIKRIQTPSTTWIEDVPVYSPPVVLLLLCVRRLRVECQAKMEVKSVEMYLQEVEAQAALQQHDNALVLTNVYVHLPRDASSSGKMELTVRAPYVSQMFIFQALWQRSLLESLASINRIFDRGAAIFREKMKANPYIRRRGGATKQAERSLVVAVTGSHGNVRVDLGSGNAHLVSVGSMSLALVIAQSSIDQAQKVCIDASVRSIMLRSEGVLSGVARVDTIYLKGFSLSNSGGSTKVVRSPAGRTFRYLLCAQKLHAVFKERQLRDLLEGQVGEIILNFMDSTGEGVATNVRLDVSLSRSNVVITPSTAPTFVRTFTDWCNIVAEQSAAAKMKLAKLGMETGHTSPEEDKGESGRIAEQEVGFHASGTRAGRGSSGREGRPPLHDNFDIIPSFVAIPEEEEQGQDKVIKSKDGTCSGSNSDAENTSYIPFMGNKLTRIPCGSIEVVLDRSSILLGNASGGVDKAGCIIATFPHATLSFAECPSEEDTVVKRVLEINTNNMELYRPGATKVLILGFHGTNRYEFYTRQKVGSSEVGYVMTLHQVHPWTGNPGLQDFQELIQLVRSFKATKKTKPFQRFGEIDDMWNAPEGSMPMTPPGADNRAPTSTAVVEEEGERGGVDADIAISSSSVTGLVATSLSDMSSRKGKKAADKRYMKPLRNVQFAPQLRFGGAVAVNVDVILNWFGITKNMLPHIIHTKACDVLEGVLCFLEGVAAGRTRKIKES